MNQIVEGWPRAWGPRRSPRQVALLVFVVAMAVGFLGAAVAVAGSNLPVAAFAAGLSVIGFLHAVVASAPPRRRPGSTRGVFVGRCPRNGEPGLAFSYNPTIRVAQNAQLITVVVVAVGAVAYGLAGGTIGNRSSTYAVLFGTGLAVASGGYLIDIARGAIKLGALWLTPSGVVNDGWSGGAAVGWRSIESVGGHQLGRTPHLCAMVSRRGATDVWRTSRLWKLSEHAELPSVWIPAPALAADPLVALRALRHYLGHPDDRAELGTPAALKRLRQPASRGTR